MNSLQGNINNNNNNFYNFGDNKYLNASKEFLNSNSFVAKLGFLILIIFVFIILLRLGIIILSYIFSNSNDPIIINGMVNGENLIVKEQNPNKKDSVPIIRSNNENDGLEYTWSSWIYINNPSLHNINSTQYKHIFNKGNDIMDQNGIVIPNNSPGVYLSPNYKELHIIINTFDTIGMEISERIIIDNIPIEKWINIIIRCEQKNIDVFINGTLTRSKLLKSIPRQNYDNINIGLNGGFQGKLSSLRYYSRSININEIQNLVNYGPNLKVLNSDLENSKPYYLSFRWFYDY